MPQIFSLPFGYPVTIAQNEVWAMPGPLVYISTSVALEGAFSSTGPWISVPGTPGPESRAVAVPFIRCPTAVASVVCKKG